MDNALAVFFAETASAIREKTGITDKMKPAEFPERIRNIQMKEGAVLKELTITENGIYEPTEVDGYSKVTVDVGPGEDVFQLTFLGVNGELLYEKRCVLGDDSFDPVASGKIATPAKEATLAVRYHYSGWTETQGGEADENALKAITSDKILYAAFSEEAILYHARFWDGESLLADVETRYGEEAEAPTVETREDFVFKGWNPSELTVYADTDFYAVWEEAQGWIMRKERMTMNEPTAAVYHPTADRLYVYEHGTKSFTTFDTSSYPYTRLSEQTSLISDDGSAVNILEISHDGNYTVYLKDAAYGTLETKDPTAKMLRSYNLSSNKMTNAHFIPNTTNFVSAYRDTDYAYRLQNDGMSTGVKYGSVNAVYRNAVSVNNEGNRVAIVDYNMDNADAATVYTASGSRVSACPKREGGYTRCTFDYAGKYLLYISRTAKAIFCYDTSQSPYQQISFSSRTDDYRAPYSVNIPIFVSKNKEFLFYKSTDNKLICYDMRTTPYHLVTDFPEITDNVDDVVVSKDLDQIMILNSKANEQIFLKYIPPKETT